MITVLYITSHVLDLIKQPKATHTLSASQYQNQLPSIEIVEINNTKQLPHVEKPDEFMEQVRILFADEE